MFQCCTIAVSSGLHIKTVTLFSMSIAEVNSVYESLKLNSFSLAAFHNFINFLNLNYSICGETHNTHCIVLYCIAINVQLLQEKKCT